MVEQLEMWWMVKKSCNLTSTFWPFQKNIQDLNLSFQIIKLKKKKS